MSEYDTLMKRAREEGINEMGWNIAMLIAFGASFILLPFPPFHIAALALGLKFHTNATRCSDRRSDYRFQALDLQQGHNHEQTT